MPRQRFIHVLLMLIAATSASVAAPSASSAAEKDDPFAVGKKWEGTMNEAKGNLKSLVVKKREDSRVVIAFDGAGGGSRWQATGVLKDGVISFDKLERTKGPGQLNLTEISGGASVNKDGSLTLQVKARASGNGTKNRPISFTFENAAAK